MLRIMFVSPTIIHLNPPKVNEVLSLSPGRDTEVTLTASEREDDDVLTPGQRTQDHSYYAMGMDSATEDNLLDANGRKRELARSGSEDDDPMGLNKVVLNLGNFVNSLNPFTGDREHKKAKKEIRA